MKGANFLKFWVLVSCTCVFAQNPPCEQRFLLRDTSSTLEASLSMQERNQLYYEFSPPIGGEGVYRISTCHLTQGDTRIEIYEGSCEQPFIAYSDDDCDLQSQLYFYAKEGILYLIKWTTYGEAFSFQWSFTKEPTPIGLSCQTPILLTDTSSFLPTAHEDLVSKVMYYQFRPSEGQEGVYLLSSCGLTESDTYLQVLEGDCEQASTIVISDDDCALQARAYFEAERGKTYFFLWETLKKPQSFAWEFLKVAHPEGLTCNTPILLSSLTNRIHLPHLEKKATHLYYRFSPTIEQESVYRLSLAKESLAPVLVEVFEGSCLLSKKLVSFSSLSNGNAPFYFFAESGRTYQIRCTNPWGDNYYLDVSRVESKQGLTCNNPILLMDSASLIIAPHEELRSKRVFYRFTPKSGKEGLYRLSSCGLTKEDTKVELMPNLCSAEESGLSSDDDCQLQSSLLLYADSGRSYEFVWENLGESRSYNWALRKEESPRGTTCENPIHLVDTASNLSATHELLNADTLFFCFSPTLLQEGEYSIQKKGSLFDTVQVEVLEWNCSRANPILFSRFLREEEDKLNFQLKAGKSYLIRLIGKNRKLNYQWSLSKQKNTYGLNCEKSIVLIDTSSAILAPHQALLSGFVYYRFTPSRKQAGVYLLSSCGSTLYDTQVEVVEGNCVDGDIIAFSDDSCGLASKLHFLAQYGKTYFIKWFNHSGTMDYHWSFFKEEELLYADSVFFDKDSFSCDIGDEFFLPYKFRPLHAASLSLRFELDRSKLRLSDSLVGKIQALSSGLSTVSIEVRTPYTVLRDSCKIYVNSNETQLASLELNKGTLFPPFHPDTLQYLVLLNEDLDSVHISGTALHEKAVLTDTGAYKIGDGGITVNLCVKAENQNMSRTYVVKVQRLNEVKELSERYSSVRFYPNPVKNTLFIESDEVVEELILFTVLGEFVWSKEKPIACQIDLSGLEAQLYLLMVRTRTGVSWKKIRKTSF